MWHAINLYCTIVNVVSSIQELCNFVRKDMIMSNSYNYLQRLLYFIANYTINLVILKYNLGF